MAESRRQGTVKWNGDRSADGRWMIQTAHVRHQGTEHRLLEAEEPPGPPFTVGRGIYDTRREAKAEAQRLAELLPRKHRASPPSRSKPSANGSNEGEA